ncbi:MAG TPA: CAP domain-containing protein [Herpetosiphonaceae bacterium]
MQTQPFGSQDTTFFQHFTAKAGDKIRISWGNGTPDFKTIMTKANFEAGAMGGPGPQASDESSAEWQVASDGDWVAILIVPNTDGDFTASATKGEGAPVKVYPQGELSYGDFDAATGDRLVQEVLRLANERRMNPASREAAAEGMGDDPGAAGAPLILDAALSRAAQSHCMNMGRDDFASHDGKDGSSFTTRIGVAGFRAKQSGEILCYGHGTPEAAIKAWMGSTHGHRGNLLKPLWSHVGIGVYYTKDDSGEAPYRYYWAMVFAVPQ